MGSAAAAATRLAISIATFIESFSMEQEHVQRWQKTSRQSGALGMRGIGAEQGEFQKTLLGFYDHSVLEGSMVRGCRMS
jgi:hypothetical protein